MGKLEKAIKIHMVYGLIFLFLPPPYNGVAFGLYPPLNILFFYPYKPMWWLVVAPLVIIVIEFVEWNILKTLKKRRRDGKAGKSDS